MLQFGIPIQVEEFKAAGDEWEVSGYASTFGNIDLGNDVVLPGAFARTLADGHRVKFLHSHDPRAVLGVPRELREDKRGLFGRFKISRTQLGGDTRQLLADGAMDSFSIGYVAQDFDLDRKSGVRQLKGIDLMEVSLVAMAMNPQALVTGMKAWADLLDLDGKAVWDTAFINTLPDAAFAVIEPGGEKDEDGKTVPRSLRHLPHHNSSVKDPADNDSVDLPHLRNALARAPQMTISAELKQRAIAHLNRHAKALQVGEASTSSIDWTLVERAAMVQADIQDIADNLRSLTEKERELTDTKRRELTDLLATFASLDAVRSDLQRLLAAPTHTGTQSLALRLALTRRKLAAQGILEG